MVLVVYLAGAILSYGRSFASFYEIEEKFADVSEPSLKGAKVVILMATLLSWIGFLGGIMVRFHYEEKYFLKYSMKDLKRRYKDAKKRNETTIKEMRDAYAYFRGHDTWQELRSAYRKGEINNQTFEQYEYDVYKLIQDELKTKIAKKSIDGMSVIETESLT